MEQRAEVAGKDAAASVYRKIHRRAEKKNKTEKCLDQIQN